MSVISTFHDPIIKINNNSDHAEEEEALEDQKRRDEEIGNQLQSAFDDLEADENSIEISSNFQSKIIESNEKGSNGRNGIFPEINHGHDQIGSEYVHKMYQLEMIVQSQINQIKSYECTAKEEKNKREELEKRLAISEAERDRINSTKNFEHELLVESKEKCSNLENEITQLKSEIKLFETDNDILRQKLENCQTLLADVQSKYNMVEKYGYAQYEKNVEKRYKNLEESYQTKTKAMQQKIESLNNKLDEKENELENVNSKLAALQKSQELLLIAKASNTIEFNDAVVHVLKETDNFKTPQNYAQDHTHCQRMQNDFERIINEKNDIIVEQKSQQELIINEVELMIGIIYDNSLNDSIRRRSELFNHKLTNGIEKVIQLKKELHHVVKKYKEKCNQLKKFQEVIDSQNEEIKKLRKEENDFLIQITTLKEENLRLENRIKNIEEEFNKNKNQLAENTDRNFIDHLKVDKKKLQEEINMLEKIKTSLIVEINNLKNSKKVIEGIQKQNKNSTESSSDFGNINNKLQEKVCPSDSSSATLNGSQSKVKNKSNHGSDSENVFPKEKGKNPNSCYKCMHNELETSKLKETCFKSKKDIASLNDQLIQAKKLISEMYEKIGLCNQQNEVIIELKQKADKFEEYIKTQCNVLDSPRSDKVKNQENSKETNSDISKTIATRIRNEMAQIFATELKSYQQQYQTKICQLQKHILSMQESLKERQNEVGLLKHAILSEREKSKELLASKCSQTEEELKRQNLILDKCRESIKIKNQLIAELEKELNERQSQIEAERKSMKAVMEQWEEHQKSIDAIEENWKKKIEEINKNHQTIMISLKSKYNSAKKTAENYKRYAEDKEKHMLREYDRIKSEYELSLAKIETRMKKKNRMKSTNEIQSNDQQNKIDSESKDSNTK